MLSGKSRRMAISGDAPQGKKMTSVSWAVTEAHVIHANYCKSLLTKQLIKSIFLNFNGRVSEVTYIWHHTSPTPSLLWSHIMGGDRPVVQRADCRPTKTQLDHNSAPVKSPSQKSMWLCFSMALVFLNAATTEMDVSLSAWNAGLWFESRPSQGCCSDERRGTPGTSGLEMPFIHTHSSVRPNVSVCVCVCVCVGQDVHMFSFLLRPFTVRASHCFWWQRKANGSPVHTLHTWSSKTTHIPYFGPLQSST